jgi:UDP-N-acetylglucosamine--N-acetylmuramyl-(pentapeptide) pyrophosphoryl-undecaprenol N-acetylglucosamine transferase
LLGSLWGLAVLTVRTRPSLFVGTGGYASGPACAWALLTGIPFALQEQNSLPGLANRWLSRWARQVHLGFPEAEHQLRPGRRTEVHAHGNPIEPPPARVDRSAARARLGLAEDSTVLLVVGGSQGSRAINDLLLSALERVGAEAERPESMEILWATGPAHIEGIQNALEPMDLEWVHAVGYIDEMPQALACADLALSRAGAMGTAELLAWGVPSVLVPLPTAAADHQTHNARALQGAGAAMALPESEASPERLWSEVEGLVRDPDRRRDMALRARERARPEAARYIAEDLLRMVHP